MCGQGTRTAANSKEKLRFAEQLMSLEQIDILVLTETHTVSLPVSRQVKILEQSGLASRAGVAILARADTGWEVLHKQILIPGHVIIVHLTNRINRESFWVLGVYGDISQGLVSLGQLMERLRFRMSAFVKKQAKTHWGGCFAIGDWNFVEHAGDRYPSGGNHNVPKRLMANFEDLKKLCAMKDVSGRGPAPKAWTYSKMTHNGMTYSWLDRIYRPSSCWENGRVMPIATKWSDHRILVATVHVRKPKVDRAIPAPRLPAMEVLDKAKKFWPSVLSNWDELTKDRPVTLEKWRTFKDKVTLTGWKEVAAMKAMGRKDWIAALWQERVAPEDILSAVAKANTLIWTKREPPARLLPHWPAVIPAYEDAPAARRGFTPSPSSPWQIPVHPKNPPPGTTSGNARFVTLKRTKGVSDLLLERTT